MSLRIVRSQQTDVFLNLALEEYLLDHVAEETTLFLWQANHAVVVGKNQNPWRECRLDRLADDKGVLARRVSGGGAVYHDLGNLNYAIFQPRDTYKEQAEYDFLLGALARLGVKAERMGKTSIAVSGKKISGTAFCLRRSAALHHGTLLVKSDLARLRSYLEPHELTIETRAITSEPAPVTNLGDVVSGLSMEEVADALIETFSSRHAEAPVFEDAKTYLALAEVRAHHERITTWEWCYGHTPPFTVTLPAGVQLKVRKGIVEEVTFADVSLSEAEQERLKAEVLGKAYRGG